MPFVTETRKGEELGFLPLLIGAAVSIGTMIWQKQQADKDRKRAREKAAAEAAAAAAAAKARAAAQAAALARQPVIFGQHVPTNTLLLVGGVAAAALLLTGKEKR